MMKPNPVETNQKKEVSTFDYTVVADYEITGIFRVRLLIIFLDLMA